MDAGNNSVSGLPEMDLARRPVLLEDGAEDINLHCPYKTLLRSMGLAPVELETGNHALVLEWEGAPDSVASPPVGIDFIWVQRK